MIAADTRQAELEAELQREVDRRDGAEHDLHRAVGDRTGPRGGIITWLLDDAALQTRVAELAPTNRKVARAAAASIEAELAVEAAQRALDLCRAADSRNHTTPVACTYGREGKRMAMKLRNVRVGDELWNAAQAAAADNGTDLSAVVRQALADYVAGAQTGKLAAAIDDAQAALDRMRELAER